MVTCDLTMCNFRIARNRNVIFWHLIAMLVQCPHHTYLKKFGVFPMFIRMSTKYQLSIYPLFFFGVCRLVEIISFILGQRKRCDIWHVRKNYICPFKSDEERKLIFLQRGFSFGILCLHSKWQTLILLATNKLFIL